MLNLVYTGIVGNMYEEDKLARFHNALEQPLPGEIEKPSTTVVDDEMALFMSSFGSGGG